MENPLVQPDPGLFIWTILTFLALVALLAKFAWRPLLQALERRQEMIRKSLDDAEQAKVELERVQRESAEIVRRAREEADAIVSRTRTDADRLREELRQQARQEAAAILKAAERQIQIEADRAREQLRREAVDMSVLIASKILRRTISREDNERLIQETLAQLERKQ